jgi:hypothetical protein
VSKKDTRQRNSLPSVKNKTLGKELLRRVFSFIEDFLRGTRQRALCRVPKIKRSAKNMALGKEPNSGSARPGGNDGCARRGRRRQRQRWPRGARVALVVARGAVVSGDGGHTRRGWPWRPSTTNSSDPTASATSFDLAASESSSGDELSDPCLCH